MTQSPALAGDQRLANPSILNQFSRPHVVVRRSEGQPLHTNALPIVLDIVFDQPVVDFPIGINVGGVVFTGTAAGLHYETTGEKANYRLTVRSVEEDGTIALAIPAELTADTFGNVNFESNSDDGVVHLDATRPQCIIKSDQEGVMNDARMAIALVFSEPVYGLRDDALSVENATLARVGGNDGDTQYHFVVTPKSDGTTALTVPEDAVVDAVGNGNVASPVFSLIIDSTGPEVALEAFETPRESNSWVMRVHAVFNEPVYDFEKSDVLVRGGSLLNFTGREDGLNYLFDVKPSEGLVQVSIPAGVARDVIGNLNSPSEVLIREIDRSRPSPRFDVLLYRTDTGAIPVDIIFSEPVYGFEDSAVKVSGGHRVRTSGTDGDTHYRFLITPSGKGRVELRLDGGVATDLAGNSSRGASTRFVPSTVQPTPKSDEEAGLAAPRLIP